MRTLSVLALLALNAGGWHQWARNPAHHSASPVAGQPLGRIEAQWILDPFADEEKAQSGGNLLVHYQVPIVDGDDLYLVVKTGDYTTNLTRETQIWNVQNVRRTKSGLATRWTYETDWKPVPSSPALGGPSWEPVYHTALTRDAVWAPAPGGAMDKLDRATGVRLARINPFGDTIDTSIFVTGPPTADDAGNIIYTAIQLDPAEPWRTDARNSWLVRIGADGSVKSVTIASLTATAPKAADQCTTQFSAQQLPWPPSRDAVAPTAPCGSQRPGINAAPAIAPDGTIYTVTRAHLNDRWAFLVAANADLTPRWASTLRNRFLDGCNVLIPQNGTPGGCRVDSFTGIDPADNQRGSGRVLDTSTSSPVVAPDGRIFYGAYTRYNYAQGHLMVFSPAGAYAGAYPFGWDLTPAIYRRGDAYSILLKENHYGLGSYCGPPNCPNDRTATTPNDPEAYFITSLDPQLELEWKFKNTETRSCGRDDNGVITCGETRPNGFEWCVNAIAVDRRGVVYANAEDGYLYAINPDGKLRERLFLRLALGAAYTPLSIGDDGAIYTQNDGRLFVVSGQPRRRSARH